MPDVGIEGHDDLPSAPSVATPPLLLEQLADVVYIAVFEPKVRFEYVSSNVVDLIGWTAEDHYRDPDLVRRSIDPRDADQLAQFITARVGQPFSVTLRWIHRDGSTVWLQHRVITALRADGSLVAHGIARDVTSVKIVEKHLTDTERLYRLVSEHTSDVVFQSDEHGVLRWISPSVSQTLGWRPVDLVGRNGLELLAPGQDLAVIEEQRRALRYGKTHFVEFELLVRTAERGDRWVAARGRALYDDAGEVTGWAMGLRDIHDEVMARRALAASEEQAHLVQAHGWTQGQGYLFSRPQPLEHWVG